MICELCEAEMALEKKIPLEFTSPRFAELGFFNVPSHTRSAEMYICPECGNVQFGAEPPEEEQPKNDVGADAHISP